ncbi:MAG: nitroreductase family protein [Deltaproteobacteria bacterium]|nr:nitroreductase family protein [Deltaproteobacteria bacterium]
MKLQKLIQKNRSCRRFHQSVKIDQVTLVSFINLARLSASAANLQPLKYILSWSTEKNDLIFPNLGWAGYLKDWSGPIEGERPSAYIMILGDKSVSRSFDIDCGIAAQSILLGATEAGLGGCIIATLQQDNLMTVLGIPDIYDILIVIALGKPKEVIQIDPLGLDGDIKYWRDKKGKHHVPKRSLKDIIID